MHSSQCMHEQHDKPDAGMMLMDKVSLHKLRICMREQQSQRHVYVSTACIFLHAPSGTAAFMLSHPTT